jgi:hypothetical protein
MLPPFFSFNLSPPSGIATFTALRAIRRFRRQHCSRSSDPDKFTFLLHFQNFSIIELPLDHMACGIRELHATPTMFAIYRWKNSI